MSVSVKDVQKVLLGWGPELLGPLLQLLGIIKTKKNPKKTLADLARIAAHETATDVALAHMKPAKKP